MAVRRNFVFDEEKDKDLLDALDAMRDGEKSRAVRDGLRLHLQMPGDIRAQLALLVRSVSHLHASVEELRASVNDLKQNGLIAANLGRNEEDEDEDDEFTATLLEIGL